METINKSTTWGDAVDDINSNFDDVDYSEHLHLPRVNDENMATTGGTKGELVYNVFDDYLYYCTATADPGTWAKIKTF